LSSTPRGWGTSRILCGSWYRGISRSLQAAEPALLCVRSKGETPPHRLCTWRSWRGALVPASVTIGWLRVRGDANTLPGKWPLAGGACHLRCQFWRLMRRAEQSSGARWRRPRLVDGGLRLRASRGRALVARCCCLKVAGHPSGPPTGLVRREGSGRDRRRGSPAG